jgi:hypothetical protein
MQWRVQGCLLDRSGVATDLDLDENRDEQDAESTRLLPRNRVAADLEPDENGDEQNVNNPLSDGRYTVISA